MAVYTNRMLQGRDKAMSDTPFHATVLQAESDSDVIFCLQSFSKTLNCTLNLISRE